MTTKDDTPTPAEGPPGEVTTKDRRARILDLWGATLKGLKDRLEGDDAKDLSASFFDVVVDFLRDSGINADTVTEAKDAVSDLHADIARQVKEVMADDVVDFTPTASTPEKASTESAVVVPLDRPFAPRPPR